MCLIVVDLFDARVRACASMDPARPTGSCLKDVLLHVRTVFRRLLYSTFTARLFYGFFGLSPLAFGVVLLLTAGVSRPFLYWSW